MGFEIARLDLTLDLDDGLHGLQNCTSMWVQFWGIIYNIILYYYNEYFIKLHRCAILQFMQFFTQIHRFTDSHIRVGSIKLHNNIIILYIIFIMTKI